MVPTTRCSTISDVTALLLAIPLFASLSCASSNGAAHGLKLANTGEPALHAVHSRELNQIMADLGSSTSRSWPQEMQADREAAQRQDRNGRIGRAAKLAEALGEASDKIPNALNKADLTPEELAIFMKLVDLMRAQSAELAHLAEVGNVDRMNDVLDGINATCNVCHSSFRQFVPQIAERARI